MQAASDLFANKGYAGTTTRSIAETAGVNEVTLFRHFGSKENLFTIIELRILQNLISKIDESLYYSSNGLQAAINFTKCIFKFSSAHILHFILLDLFMPGMNGFEVLEGIRKFEATGEFDPISNYAFGEGGAGTFSDGKLTSRSKHISLEREFIISSYINAGAPESIKYMAHPHLGSDNLKNIIKVLREQFLEIGGKVLFETFLEDIKIKDGKVYEAVTTKGVMEADRVVIAPGNSAYETYRMLIDRGVEFRPKNFAIGARVEHPQEIINKAQWGRKNLSGVKAAEYRLTSSPTPVISEGL